MTGDPAAMASPSVFPVSLPDFADQVEVGEFIQFERYLATGADGATLSLEVRRS